MNLLKQQCKGMILLIIIFSGIVACKNDSKDKVIDGLNKDKLATIGFVNAVNERATFYAKAKALKRSTFDSENRVA